MRKWRPVDWIVLVVAATVCLSVMGAVVKALWTGALNDAEEENLGLTIAALIAMVSLYVGAKLRDRDQDVD